MPQIYGGSCRTNDHRKDSRVNATFRASENKKSRKVLKVLTRHTLQSTPEAAPHTNIASLLDAGFSTPMLDAFTV